MQLCKYYPVANDRMGRFGHFVRLKIPVSLSLALQEQLTMQLRELEV